MKVNELISRFTIAMTNEEAALLEKMQGVRSMTFYTEREQFVIENLIRKSLVSKVTKDNSVYVVKNG
jgi:transposase-like protein